MTLKGCRDYPAVVVNHGRSDSLVAGIVFEDVIFEDNTNKDSYTPGGALYVGGCFDKECDAADVDVTIRDSVFRENASPMGGAIFGEQCALTVMGTNFTDNRALSNGGAIYVAGARTELNVSNCRFVKNTVVEEGFQRLIYQESGLLIERSRYFVFQSPANGGGAIAAISAGNLTVTHSEFKSNRATSGGAIYASLDATELIGLKNSISVVIAQCLFRDNVAAAAKKSRYDNVGDHLGGAVYFASSATTLAKFDILTSIFTDNRARSSGGALHMVTLFQNPIALDGCTFENNWAGEAGGAAVFRNTGDIRALRTTWTENSAVDLGGALLLTNGAQFTAAPVLDAAGEEAPGEQNLFARNSAKDGGALICAGCGILLLRNVYFTNNQATEAGGGLFVLDSFYDVDIEQCSFRDNAAVHGGGAAFRAAAQVRFASAKENWWNEFVNNTAVSGGGVFVDANRQKENSFQVCSNTPFAPFLHNCPACVLDETFSLYSKPSGRC